MTCIICGYEFCWICLGYCGYDANHFSMSSPYYCGASQFGDRTNRSMFCDYLKIFLAFIFAVIMAPIVYVLYFVIGGLICGAIVFSDCLPRDFRRGIFRFVQIVWGTIGAVLGCALGIVIGVILSPFALLLFLLGICAAIGFAVKHLFDKVRNSINRRRGGRFARPEEDAAR